MYDEFVKKKDVKREASGTVHQLYGGGRSEAARFAAKFDRNDPRQLLITEAIAKMIIRDLQAVQIVENEGFRELLQLLEPRYTPETCLYIQKQLLPGYSYQVQLAIKQSLIAAESCSITLDLWKGGVASSLGGYLGVTCHFITADWQIQSALLACIPLVGNHTVQQVLSECDEISHAHGVMGKVFRVVADASPSESRAMFRLPGFYLHGGEQDEEEEESSDEHVMVGEAGEAGRAGVVDNSLDLCFGAHCIDCFARSLGLCVREGLRTSPQLSIALTKAACLYNYVTATVAPEKLSQAYWMDDPVIRDALNRERGWNCQLKMVRRLLESAEFLEDVVNRHDLTLTSFEKAVLRELVEVLEPFEEATDMVQGDKHVSISLAVPCVLGLRKHLSETATRQCTGILVGLAQSLDRRLSGILEDPLYVTATALDPQFKLTWSSDTERHRQVLLREVARHIQVRSPQEPSQEPTPPPSKCSKLFSFIKQRPASQPKSIEQELETYLLEDPTEEYSLHYWKRKAIDFPQLSQVAKKVFTVPATTTPVENILKNLGKILRPERCRLLPKNLETLIYLKANYRLLWI